MGRRAAQTLLALMDDDADPPPPGPLLLPGELRVRRSVRGLTDTTGSYHRSTPPPAAATAGIHSVKATCSIDREPSTDFDRPAGR